MDDAALDDVLGVAAAMDELLDRNYPRLTSRWELVPRQIAAAQLARCHMLTRSIRLVVSNDLMPVAGSNLRELSEAFATGIVFLHGDENDFMKLAGDHKRNARNLLQRNDLDASQLQEWDFAEARSKIEDVMSRAGDLLRDAGDADAQGPARTLYNLLYRSESTLSSHGLGSAMRFVTQQPDWLGVATNPAGLVSGAAYIGLGASYTLYLASHVLDVFGLSSVAAEDLYKAVMKLHLHDDDATSY